MPKTKVGDLLNRPRFRQETGTDPSFVGASFILGSQANPQSKNRARQPSATGHSSIDGGLIIDRSIGRGCLSRKRIYVAERRDELSGCIQNFDAADFVRDVSPALKFAAA